MLVFPKQFVRTVGEKQDSSSSLSLSVSALGSSPSSSSFFTSVRNTHTHTHRGQVALKNKLHDTVLWGSNGSREL